MSWKTSLLLRSEFLGLFGRTLISDHMYSRLRSEKFPKQVQTLFCQKEKTFCKFLLHFCILTKIMHI